MCYAVDDGPVQVWVPGDRVPEHLAEAELHAWNSQFEYVIWRMATERYGFPEVRLEQWHDTAARAAVLALPRSLAQCAEVLDLESGKDQDGHRLMMQMSRPRTTGAWWADDNKGPFSTKAQALRESTAGGVWQDEHTLTWWDDERRINRLIEYCKRDVEVERNIANVLRELSPAERQVELMTHRMNDRGVRIDLRLVNAARRIVKQAEREGDKRLAQVTGGEVCKVKAVRQLKDWLSSRGVELEDLRKATVRDALLRDDLSDEVREVLELRQGLAKTSTAKLDAMRTSVTSDERVHGLLLYHGASTGRWAGRLVQPQNFPRPELDAEVLIPAVLRGNMQALHEVAQPPVVIASMLRSMLTAAPGRVFMAADYAQIEARVLAWLAGAKSLTDLFAANGLVYETMAATIFNKAVNEVTGFERQIGKNSILGAGYQMGAARFKVQVQEQGGIEISDELAEAAIGGYRSLYPEIPRLWRNLEKAAVAAVEEPGTLCTVNEGDRTITFGQRGKFLYCQLPSRRRLAYFNPKVKEGKSGWRKTLSYEGLSSVTKKWRRQDTYGGHLTENVIQAIARDLMAGAMLRLEAAGFEPVMTVHDEVVVEADTGDHFHQFMSLVRKLPKWGGDLPIAAEGWQGERYRK
jgi:DNA polymerase